MSLCIKDLNKFILFDEDLNRYLIKFNLNSDFKLLFVLIN